MGSNPTSDKTLFWVDQLEMNRESCEQQSGAVEACWAHNPEVGRSKLPSAITFFLPLFCLSPLDPFKIPKSSQSVPLAQRIARWTSNPKVLGSIPRWDDTYFLENLSPNFSSVRMAEWSKAPDSRFNPCSLDGECRMRILVLV